MQYFINISNNNTLHPYYQDAYHDLHKKYGIKTILFYDKNKEKDITNGFHADDTIETYPYTSHDDLIQQILSIPYKDIYYINTFDEKLILITNHIKQLCGFSITDHYQAFRDKDLQRNILQKHSPQYTIKHHTIGDHESPVLSYPFIIKPTSGIQSAGVALIQNEQEYNEYRGRYHKLTENLSKRNIEETKHIIEEYIDGDMYTINYFVNATGVFTTTPLVKVHNVYDIEIEDFANYVRVAGKIIESDIDEKELNILIQDHIDAFGIRNTFIHHELKKTSTGSLKTIELNGRIGGYKIEMMRDVYNYNMLTMPMGAGCNRHTPLSHATFVFYPSYEGVLEGFDISKEELLKNLPSTQSLRLHKKKIGQSVGLTKQGYTSLGTLILNNQNLKQFQQDYQIIKDNYTDLLVVIPHTST